MASAVHPVAASPRSAVRALSIVRPVFDRVLPAALFGALAVAKVYGLSKLLSTPVDAGLEGTATHWLGVGHVCLTLAFTALVAVLFATRRTPVSGRAGPLGMTVALAGTFIMWFALTQPATTDDWRVLAISDSVAAVGLAFSIYALGALRFCFGMAPEARGLVTNGAYRLVRHPVYLGEYVSLFGALMPVLAPLTILIFVAFCLLQAWRAQLEESVLAETFPDYAAYRLRTPALLPWPWSSRKLRIETVR